MEGTALAWEEALASLALGGGGRSPWNKPVLEPPSQWRSVSRSIITSPRILLSAAWHGGTAGQQEDPDSGGRAQLRGGDSHALWGPEMKSQAADLHCPSQGQTPLKSRTLWVLLPLRGGNGSDTRVIIEANVYWVLFMCDVMGKLSAI